jgi:hypothetical protein
MLEEGSCLQLPLQFAPFYRPKGEKRTAQAFRPGNVPKRNRPERAADCRALFPKKNVRRKQVAGVSAAYESLPGTKVCGGANGTGISAHRNKLIVRFKFNPDSAALSGRFSFYVVPRPEGLGYHLFALRAIGTGSTKCPSPRRDAWSSRALQARACKEEAAGVAGNAPPMDRPS